jgi:hypothetical protein
VTPPLPQPGPPLFLKVRPRASLGDLEASQQPAAVAEAFWQEVLAQNWKTELDYGLGKRGAHAEQVLVVAGARCVGQLLAALGAGAAGAAAGPVEVEADGWNAGVPVEQQRPLASWRDLRPRPVAGAGAGAADARGGE